MPIYQYKVLTTQGKQERGVYTASTKEDVYLLLKKKGYFPLEVIEKQDESTTGNISFSSKVNSKQIAVFCRQFHTMLNAGVPIIQCLDILHQQTEHKQLKVILEEVYEQVQQGLSLSEAFQMHQPTIPSLLVHMIEAGETSGNLDLILERMAIHYEKEYKLNNKIKSAMVYPMVLSIVAIIVVIFLLTFVMPTFMELFQGSGVEMPAPTKFLLSMSEALKNKWYILLGILFIITILFFYLKRTPVGIQFIDTTMLQIPILGKTINTIIVSRFTRTLSTLLSSGVPLLQAMDISAKIVNNVVVGEGLLKAKEEVRKGVGLSQPLRQMKLFPPMVISMIEIGEEAGALDDLLDKTANFYDEEAETALQKLTTMLEPIMIVIMAIIIGFIVISMVLPMFDMMNTVQM